MKARNLKKKKKFKRMYHGTHVQTLKSPHILKIGEHNFIDLNELKMYTALM